MPNTEMIINHVPGEECRIAIAEDGKLEEFYQERASTQSHVGNIYKGRVVNVEPAIQAAFVDFGLERNGFLHITDLHPKYFPGPDREAFEKVGKKTARHERPPIQQCVKRGQEVLVQVLKEGIGTKGPTVTSYLSIPGRFLVMMPDMQRLGVSRKVEDDDARKEMRDILKTLDPPKDFGFIVRTAGIGQTKTDLKRDLSYLARLWKDIESKRKARGKFGELYAESDLVIRTIRDVFSSDIDRIVCDDPVAARRARDFLAVANPRAKSKVVHYDDPVPVFDRMGIEPQIANISAREVPLPSGGALVIDSTEALVAVDVNSGKSRAARDAETNAYKTNLEAVDEIARQLRLRDLGGLVVLDLIDMRPAKNRKAVESRFKANLKKDRSRTRVGGISQFGLLEMTRQRMRPSLRSSIYRECAQCTGRGYAMSPESVVLSVMRQLALVMHRDDVARIELTISPDVAFHILNRKRGELVDLESRYGKRVMVRVGGGTIDHIGMAAFNATGGIAPVELRPRKLSADDARQVFRELDDSDLPEPEAEEDLDDTFFDDKGEAQVDTSAEADSAEDDADVPAGKRKRRRRRSRGRTDARDPEAESQEAENREVSAPPLQETEEARANDPDAPEDTKPGGRRRRRGRGRSKAAAEPITEPGTDEPIGTDDNHEEPPTGGGRRRRERGRSRAEDPALTADDQGPAIGDGASADGDEAGAPAGRRRRRRRRGPGAEVEEQQTDTGATSTPDQAADAESDNPDAPRRRRRRRRRGGAGEDLPADPDAQVHPPEDATADTPEPDRPADADADAPELDDATPVRRTRRARTRRRTAATDDGTAETNAQTAQAEPGDTAETVTTTEEMLETPPPARTRRSRGRKRATKPTASAADPEPNGNPPTAPDQDVPSVPVNTDADPAPTKKKPPRRPGRGYSNRVVY